MILEDFSFEAPKTKRVMEILNNLKLDTTKVVFVTTNLENNLVMSARNIPYTNVQRAPEFSVYDILNADYVLFQKGAVQVVNEVLAK